MTYLNRIRSHSLTHQPIHLIGIIYKNRTFNIINLSISHKIFHIGIHTTLCHISISIRHICIQAQHTSNILRRRKSIFEIIYFFFCNLIIPFTRNYIYRKILHNAFLILLKIFFFFIIKLF